MSKSTAPGNIATPNIPALLCLRIWESGSSVRNVLSFLEYAITKRLKCPLEAEKPTCKHCRIHCYDKLRREKVREIMSYAGRKLMMRGRLDYLWHYFF